MPHPSPLWKPTMWCGGLKPVSGSTGRAESLGAATTSDPALELLRPAVADDRSRDPLRLVKLAFELGFEVFAFTAGESAWRLVKTVWAARFRVACQALDVAEATELPEFVARHREFGEGSVRFVVEPRPPEPGFGNSVGRNVVGSGRCWTVPMETHQIAGYEVERSELEPAVNASPGLRGASGLEANAVADRRARRSRPGSRLSKPEVPPERHRGVPRPRRWWRIRRDDRVAGVSGGATTLPTTPEEAGAPT